MKKIVLTAVTAAVILSQILMPAYAASSFDTTDNTTSLFALLADTLQSLRDALTRLNIVIQAFMNQPSQANQPAVSEKPLDIPAFVAGELLIKFKNGVGLEEQNTLFKNWGFKVKNEITQINVKQISVPEDAEEALVEALSHNPRIEFAEVNSIMPGIFIPNDPGYPNAWHHPVINDPAAWDIANGSGLTIAVADSGVDPIHPDLAANLVPGWNFYDNNSNTSDIYGHGTKVAGSEAAIGNNGIGVIGVAWNAKIMPIRVTGTNGWATLSALSSAITYAADHGVKTVNVSFDMNYNVCVGGSFGSAADYMYKKGGLVVVAAGNTGALYNCADNPEIVFAGATSGSNDVLANFSSFGPYVDVVAPGVGIYTTYNGGGYTPFSGTSAASPVTAGVLALIWSANPTLTPGQAEQILFNSAKDLGSPGKDQYYGWGRVDAGKAVALAAGVTSTPPDTTAPTTSVDFPTNGSTVAGNISVSVSASDLVGVSRVELWKDGALFSTDTTSPYSYLWDTTKDVNGSHALQSKAYDAAGNVGTSSAVTVTVNNIADLTAPSVIINKPAANSTLPSKGNTQISVRASDNVGVTEIDILFDGVLRVTCVGITTCNTNMNMRKVSSGPHTITANAFDAAGNKGTTSITVMK